MSPRCDCCTGPDVLTPAPTANRPGLGALSYRVGTWASFLETMQARLSGGDVPELERFTTRDPADPSMALLDAWAVLGDVLTFYQERIANEGYLRTATERRSVLELARLIGYRLRPGVAASVFLAFTIDKDAPPVQLPAWVGANSVPGPGEQMQTFETSHALEARAEWGALRPARTRPQTTTTIRDRGRLYLQGTSTGLRANDPLLIDVGDGSAPRVVWIRSVEARDDRTVVELASPAQALASADEPPPAPLAAAAVNQRDRSMLSPVVEALKRPPSVPPASPARLRRSAEQSLAVGADNFPRLLAAVDPRLQGSLHRSLANLPAAESPLRVFALRTTAAPFGHSAPLRIESVTEGVPRFAEWQIDDPMGTGDGGDGGDRDVPVIGAVPPAAAPASHHLPGTVFLDNDYDIAPDTWVVIEQPTTTGTRVLVDRPRSVSHRSLAAYGLSGKTVQIDLHSTSWINPPYAPDSFTTVRSTRVFVGSEELALADAPAEPRLGGDRVELDTVYPDLEPGRWLVVAGERTDVVDAEGQRIGGIPAAELVMLASASQLVAEEPGARTRTAITFAEPLAYTYELDTVTIHGNVVHATHGETRQEALGGGDASQALQVFPLKQPPVTYVAAPTASGAESTLEVRVNDLLWHEAPALADLGPDDRQYLTRTDDDDAISVVFGDGVRGARLPTGQNNVRATYRNGIGSGGNVKAGQISLLANKPLGVREVVNPIRASGGADKDTLEAGRRNAPVAVRALDRLVSVQDYADFARTFAGVGKAAAARLAGAGRWTVHVTIAGVDDIPIDVTSDLLRNLRLALHRHGDPHLHVDVAVRERLVLVMSARVRVKADHRWESVEAALRGALLGRFGFERVDLAEDLLVSDAIVAAHGVEGVDSVDVDVFDAVSEARLVGGFSATTALALARRARVVMEPGRPGSAGDPLPGQLAYLPPEVPATLILQEWTP